MSKGKCSSAGSIPAENHLHKKAWLGFGNLWEHAARSLAQTWEEREAKQAPAGPFTPARLSYGHRRAVTASAARAPTTRQPQLADCTLTDSESSRCIDGVQDHVRGKLQPTREEFAEAVQIDSLSDNPNDRSPVFHRDRRPPPGVTASWRQAPLILPALRVEVKRLEGDPDDVAWVNPTIAEGARQAASGEEGVLSWRLVP